MEAIYSWIPLWSMTKEVYNILPVPDIYVGVVLCSNLIINYVLRKTLLLLWDTLGIVQFSMHV